MKIEILVISLSQINEHSPVVISVSTIRDEPAIWDYVTMFLLKNEKSYYQMKTRLKCPHITTAASLRRFAIKKDHRTAQRRMTWDASIAGRLVTWWGIVSGRNAQASEKERIHDTPKVRKRWRQQSWCIGPTDMLTSWVWRTVVMRIALTLSQSIAGHLETLFTIMHCSDPSKKSTWCK